MRSDGKKSSRRSGSASGGSRNNRRSGPPGKREDRGAGPSRPRSDGNAGSARPRSSGNAGSPRPRSDGSAGSSRPRSDGNAGSSRPRSSGNAGSPRPRSDRNTGPSRSRNDRNAGPSRPRGDRDGTSSRPRSDRTTSSSRSRRESDGSPSRIRREDSGQRRFSGRSGNFDNAGRPGAGRKSPGEESVYRPESAPARRAPAKKIKLKNKVGRPRNSLHRRGAEPFHGNSQSPSSAEGGERKKASPDGMPPSDQGFTKKKKDTQSPARLPSGRRNTKHRLDRNVVLPERLDPDNAIDELEGLGDSGPVSQEGGRKPRSAAAGGFRPRTGKADAEEIFSEPVRINRYLARAGFGSRRQVEDYVTAGRVKINGKTVTALDSKVGPGDMVTLDGRQVHFTEGHIYMGFNKPAGYAVSARSFPGSPSIYEILPEDCQGLKYAGRLDRDSRGLLVLSNDGEFLNQVMHPARRVTKRYIVTLDELPEAEELSGAFYRGVVDEGEMLRAVRVGIISRPEKQVEVILSEGKKRQIRRMFASLDVEVLDLYRVSVGFLSLENHAVKEGSTFSFEPEELFATKKGDAVLGDFNPWKKES
ncbi:MAG: hypothetical protein KDK25_09245 [Leptospiraceae bacterium]|nr:hypothetical protein [Leptospiraceae bacterium]